MIVQDTGRISTVESEAATASATFGQSRPERGTSTGTEFSLCTSGRGGTCTFISSRAATSPIVFQPVLRTGAIFFSRPPHPEHRRMFDFESRSTNTARQFAPGVPPARRDLTSEQTYPHYCSRSTSCSRPVSVHIYPYSHISPQPLFRIQHRGPSVPPLHSYTR